MRPTLRMTVIAVASLWPSFAAAAPPPPVSVVACGQIVPKATTGILAGDLDCTGSDGIELGARAKLDLAGHTLSGDSFSGVECEGGCAITGAGAISGFKRGVSAEKGPIKVDGSITFANQINGVFSRRAVQVKGATFDGHSISAVGAGQAAKIESCVFTDNATSITSGGTVKLVASTITGGGTGIYARGANLIDSSIDTTTDGLIGVDILTLSGRPRLRNSTCAGKSQRYTGPTWGVCALD